VRVDHVQNIPFAALDADHSNGHVV
jgi:hypothetical protein